MRAMISQNDGYTWTHPMSTGEPLAPKDFSDWTYWTYFKKKVYILLVSSVPPVPIIPLYKVFDKNSVHYVQNVKRVPLIDSPVDTPYGLSRQKYGPVCPHYHYSNTQTSKDTPL